MIDKRMVKDMNALMRIPKRPILPLMDRRKGLPKARATAAPSATGSGSGINKLTEKDATTRTYHPESGITTSDGIFVLELQPLLATDMDAADGRVIPLEFGDPNAP